MNLAMAASFDSISACRRMASFTHALTLAARPAATAVPGRRQLLWVDGGGEADLFLHMNIVRHDAHPPTQAAVRERTPRRWRTDAQRRETPEPAARLNLHQQVVEAGMARHHPPGEGAGVAPGGVDRGQRGRRPTALDRLPAQELPVADPRQGLARGDGIAGPRRAVARRRTRAAGRAGCRVSAWAQESVPPSRAATTTLSNHMVAKSTPVVTTGAAVGRPRARWRPSRVSP